MDNKMEKKEKNYIKLYGKLLMNLEALLMDGILNNMFWGYYFIGLYLKI